MPLLGECPFLAFYRDGGGQGREGWGGQRITEFALGGGGVTFFSILHLEPPRIPFSCQAVLGSVRGATDEEMARKMHAGQRFG